MVDGVRVRVPGTLAFLLPVRDRAGRTRTLRPDPDATVGHLVQAAGVPLSEVGGLRIDGVPAGASTRTAPGALVEVADVRRPQVLPAGGFLLDVGLGALARRMRLLGLDAAWSADAAAADAELARRAVAEDRVLLTQDRGLLMRRVLGAAGVRRGALVRGSRPDDQLADVLDRFAPPLAPLTRCAACSGVLDPVGKDEIADRLEPGTRRSYDEFSRCRACGRVYWRGAHARRIDALLARVRARATVERTTEETDRGAPRR